MSEESLAQKKKVAVGAVPDRRGNPWLLTLKYLVKWVLLIAIGPALLLLIAILLSLLRGHGHGPHPRHMQDAKQWGYALFNFENDYGKYPNEETAEKLKQEFPDQAHLIKTETANDFMRQLVIAGYIEGGLAEGLESGEFPYAYVVGLNSSVSGSMPLLISPVEKGKYAFDKKYARKNYNKRTVVLHIDMSVSYPRAEDEFFDWSQYDLGERKLRIAWPE